MFKKVFVLSLMLFILMMGTVFAESNSIIIKAIDPYDDPADGRILIYGKTDDEYIWQGCQYLDYEGNTEFAGVDSYIGESFLIVVDGRLDLGLNGVNYTYIKEINNLTDLTIDSSNVKIIESKIINLPSDFSGYLFGDLKGIIYNKYNDNIETPVVGITNISSYSGVSSDTGYLEVGKYKLIYVSDNIYMFLDNFSLSNNYDVAVFDAADAAHLSLDVKNWGEDEYRANEKRLIIEDIDRSIYAGFPNVGESYLISPGTYNLRVEYYETDGNGVIFELNDKTFSLSDDSLRIGYGLTAALTLNKENYNQNEVINFNFSIKDDNENKLTFLYQGNIDVGKANVPATAKVIDKNGLVVLEQKSYQQDGWLNIGAIEDGNYTFEVTKDAGSYGIIKSSKNFVVGEGNNINDNYTLFDSKTCNTNKDWTITFNQTVQEASVNSEYIYIRNSNGEILTNVLTLSEDKTQVIVKSPISGYSLGNYNLYIEDGVKTSGGKNLATALRMEFTVQ